MSLSSVFSSRRVKKSAILVIGLGGVLFMTIMLARPSGAWFFDQNQVNITGATGSLKLGLIGGQSGNTDGSINIVLNNVVPGYDNTYSFTATNLGTVPGALSASVNHAFGEDFSGDTSQMSSVVFDDATYAMSTLSQVPVELATLQPGESKTYLYQVSLNPSADNAWQNQSIHDTIDLKLEQAHW